jgi:hypothetical protein
MMRWLLAIAASLVLVAAGIVHGYWTDRWVPNQATQDAAALLHNVPLYFGEWVGEEIDVKPGQAGAGVAGCIQRRYTSKRLGATVVIALVNGRPGPVATHTPEVCYGASGYTVNARKPVRLDTKGPLAQFWRADARRSNVTDETRIRLYWGWNGGEGWVASADARNQFPRFRYPVLHKLYVLRDLTAQATAPGKEEPCETFLQGFLPELDRALFDAGT